MKLKEKIEKIRVELKGWKQKSNDYANDESKFIKGYIDGRIKSLEYALAILEQK